MDKQTLLVVCVGLVCALPVRVSADKAAELAALLQDPMATISAIETDSKVGFRAGPKNDKSYRFEVQPVHAFVVEELGVSIIPRASIPFIGITSTTDLPGLANPEDRDSGIEDKGRQWGLGDIVTQVWVAPLGQEGFVKWGLGPQISWRTRSDNDVAGAGGGAGPSAVLVGDSGPWAYSILGGHLWGFDGDFSTTSLQPSLFFNFKSMPGAYLYYNNTVSYDHKTKGGNGNSWAVPLGMGIGRTLDMGEGHALDLRVGGYYFPSWGRSKGNPDYEAQLNVGWMFPR